MIQKRYCTLIEFAEKQNLDVDDLLYKLVNEEIDTYIFFSGDGKWTIHIDGQPKHKEGYAAGLFKIAPIQLAEVELKSVAQLGFLVPTPAFSHNLLSTSCPIENVLESAAGLQYFALKESILIKKEDLVVVSDDYSRLIDDQSLKTKMDTEALLQRIAELEKIPYLDINNPYYAPELALAIDIWKRLFIKKEGNPKHGTERQVEKLLNSTMEGEISNALIKRLGAIVNPKPASFARKNVQV